jgi:hypothetical protein
MSIQGINRRELICTGTAAAMGAAWCRTPPRAARVWLRVEETAGLRRFGYPIHVNLPGLPAETHLRLIKGGTVITAQFRQVTSTEGVAVTAVDFNVSLDPLATQDYEITIGDQERPGPEPAGGLKIQRKDGAFCVSGSRVTYEVPVDLVGFLRRVSNDGKEFVKEGSLGFWLRQIEPGRDFPENPAPGLRGTISRKGPLAIGLRFEGDWPLGGHRKAHVVADLTFPSSKSWVEVVWTIVGLDQVREIDLGLDVDLAIDGSPTLVDLGASGTVYGTIDTNEHLMLHGTQAGWEVDKTLARQPVLQACSGGKGNGPTISRAEGWAHVMDARRCTAVALADFGRQTDDRIDVAANGRVRLVRRFKSASRSPRTVRAWFHFVGMPVQVGAVTSPQSMLAPLKVEIL